MIEIIPNWHPIFVHFTVGLFTAATAFYVLAYSSSYLKVIPKAISDELEIVARWCLWAVALIVILTVLAGLNAYDTVRHDAISHEAMTEHRNWALPTAGAILLLAIWSGWRYYKRRVPTITFIIAVLIVQGLLFITAWHGAELVFRYGLGVISLPQAEGEGHHHHHHDEESSMAVHSDMHVPAGQEMHNHADHH